MGFNTTVNVLNDGLDQIEKHPAEFVGGLLHYYFDGGIFGVGNHANVAEVARTRHADEFCLYSIHGNAMIELSPHSRETKELVERMPDEIRNRIRAARHLLDQLEKSISDG